MRFFYVKKLILIKILTLYINIDIFQNNVISSLSSTINDRRLPMKLVRESIAAGSSLIYLITPPPNLASQRRQRFRGKPFVNLLLVHNARRIHESVECTSANEREREGEIGVPAIRTRDRPIIDVPYRCVAPGITSTKTVPSRISTAPFLLP